MNLQILKNELTNDPLTRGYSGMDDVAVTISLNAVDRSKAERVSISTIQQYLFDQGRYVELVDEATQGTGASKKVSRIILELFRSQMIDINVGHSQFQSGLTVLVTASVISQAQSDAITAMGTKTISRATELGLPNIRAGNIQEARI